MKMKRILLKFSYDGSCFHGFQRQKNVVNVQSELERVLSIIYGERIEIKGAGRTDSGVHAINHYAHFDEPKNVKLNIQVLNKMLSNIRVKSIDYVDNTFHARYSVKSKRYKYKICLDNNCDKKYYLRYWEKIDVNEMRKCCQIFVGTHDFTNFASGKKNDFTTTIFDIKLYKYNNNITITFCGIGFYRYMIRNLVGAILDVGSGKVSVNQVNKMLSVIPSKRLTTVLANGLYLVDIKY